MPTETTRRAHHRPLLAALRWLVLSALLACPALSQSGTGSRAASNLLFAGSELVAAGSTEILHGGSDLVVTSVEKTTDGLKLFLRPLADAASEAAELSATLSVEVSQEAWQAAQRAARASGAVAHDLAIVIGDVVEVVALTTSGTASAVGFVLLVGDVVLGIVAQDELLPLLGHSLHAR